MKKLMLMTMMAVAASSVFAQDNLVKEAKKLAAKDYAKAVETITPALTSSQTTDKAAAWNALTDIHYDNYLRLSEQSAKSQITHEAFDTLALGNSAIAAVEAALKCDEFDILPNAKGKVKPRFRTANQGRLKNIGGSLVQAGLNAYNHKDLKAAQKAWMLYLDMPQSSLFKDVKDMPQDEFRNDIIYYEALVSYLLEDFGTATKYAQMGVQTGNEETIKNCQEILDNAKQQNLLRAFEAKKDDVDGQMAVLDAELAKHPDFDFAWALKGQVAMNSSKWDDAVAAFDKAISLNPKFVQCYYNAGVCLNSKARELDEKFADKSTGTISKENLEKVKDVLRNSLTYLEKCQELDPDRKIANWAYPLYQVYYSLDDKAKAAEMEKLVNE